jgi:hypothetical protein
MTDDRQDPTKFWSTKKAVIFALVWLGEALLILLFVKEVIHGSAVVYLVLVPWTLLGLIMVVWPELVYALCASVGEALGTSWGATRKEAARSPVRKVAAGT